MLRSEARCAAWILKNAEKRKRKNKLRRFAKLNRQDRWKLSKRPNQLAETVTTQVDHVMMTAGEKPLKGIFTNPRNPSSAPWQSWLKQTAPFREPVTADRRALVRYLHWAWRWVLFSGHWPKCFWNDRKKIKSFWSERLKIHANELCYGEFWYNCETNDRNISAKKTALAYQEQNTHVHFDDLLLLLLFAADWEEEVFLVSAELQVDRLRVSLPLHVATRATFLRLTNAWGRRGADNRDSDGQQRTLLVSKSYRNRALLALSSKSGYSHQRSQIKQHKRKISAIKVVTNTGGFAPPIWRCCNVMKRHKWHSSAGPKRHHRTSTKLSSGDGGGVPCNVSLAFISSDES